MLFAKFFIFYLFHFTFSQYDGQVGTPLTPEEFVRAETLVAISSNSSENDPIMLANLYQGDIAMPEGTIFSENKNGIKDQTKKWKSGIVPYTIGNEFDSNSRTTIASAMLQIHKKTCVKFQPRRGERDFLHIMKGSGCSSFVGRQGGQQDLSLGNGCLSVGIIQHEMMHALGFWHEQSRADRDEHVVIYWENIKPGASFNFQKMSWTTTQNLSHVYDLNSIMHYGPYAFNKQAGLRTIVPRNSSATNIGQRVALSKIDQSKINKLYNCQAPKDTCKNQHEHCDYWARKGECDKNPWMGVNCQESCKKCGCSDKNEHCTSWEESKECLKNPSYMEANCRKSCGKCL